MIYPGRRAARADSNHDSFTHSAVSSAHMLDLQFAEFSDRGRVREQNEDYVGSVIPKTPTQAEAQGWLFALADGVGGHGEGDIASRVAIETVCEAFRTSRDYELHRALLPRLLQLANANVLEAATKSRKTGAGMATTLVACAIRSDRAVVCHVGDSRCYLVRRSHAEVLTRDHTVANDQIRLGILSKREASDSPMRHMLSRSLGGDLFVSVDVSEHQLLPQDVLLLCSDGLHGALPTADIELIVSVNPDLRIAAKELIEAANERDGSDNISVQLIRVGNVQRTGMYRGRPYKLA